MDSLGLMSPVVSTVILRFGALLVRTRSLQFSCLMTNVTLEKIRPRLLNTPTFDSSLLGGHGIIDNDSLHRRESEIIVLLSKS